MTTARLVVSLAAFVAVALGLAAAAGAESRFEREVDRLAELLGVGPGSRVADVGAGKGHFAIAFAERVGPEGHVYATELGAKQRAKLERAARDAGLGNLTVVEALEDATGLPGGCCDAIFLRSVYHHLGQPEPILASLAHALRPGGRLVVIDFRPTRWLALWTPKDLPADRGGHGVTPEIVRREAEAAGFEALSLDEEWQSSWLVRRYAITFRRP
jgi:ubiquinone/menaquinone biosynthesis C-methylase UbiE